MQEENSHTTTQPPADAVWISREEYDRLRQAETETTSKQQSSAHTATSADDTIWQDTNTKPASKATFLGVLAVILFIGFTTSLLQGEWVSIILLVFFGVAVASVINYVRKNSGKISAKQVSKNVLKVALITALVLSILPGLYIAGMILLFTIMVGFGGGRGS